LDISKRAGALPARPRVAAAAAVRPSLAPRLVTCALAVLVGLSVSWQVLGQAGVVGLVHDWSIAPFAEQHLALLQQDFDGWVRWGLGEQVAYPFEYPLRLAFGLVASLGIGGGLISKAIVVLVPALAFVAAAYLGRSCGLSYGAAWVCGAFYALDPVMLNKLVSGQTTYLVGYALLPLAPALFGQACERGSAVAGGLAIGGVVALIAMQVQLGVIAVLLLVVLGVCTTRVPLARRARVGAYAAVLLVAAEAPTIAWALHGVGDIVRLDQFTHGAAWLDTNSLHVGDALRLIGYLAEYDILSIGSWMNVWQPVSWLVVAVAVAGLLTLRGPMRPTLFIAAVVAVAFACGTTTPLGGAITWVFARFRGAQMFRELYHVMAAVSLAYAVGAGAAFDLIGRFRTRVALRAVLVAALGVYFAPMLSGDVSGWLSAFPVDRYLATAFHDENSGAGRVAWFPMDQPLAFEDRGSGVDPMAVTDRGSLWLYSLTWPLTAVDTAARSGDVSLLRDELRALGVASVVNRDRFRSRYRGVPGVADFADAFFDAQVPLDARLGVQRAEGPGVRAYAIANPLPLVRTASRIAVVPRRMSVVAAATLSGAAAFGFPQARPGGVPYDVYIDRGDRAWEALQAAGLSQPLDAPNVDALKGFAGGDVWWWYRPQYADAARFALAIGRGTYVVRTQHSLGDARLVLAWIATPAGGDVTVRCGTQASIVRTGGVWNAWRSAAVPCGAVAAGATATVSAEDADAEVALRGAALVDFPALVAAQRTYQRVIGGAGTAIVLGDGARGTPRSVRSGTSHDLGTLPAGTPATLALQRTNAAAPATVRIEGRSGYLVAWGRFAAGAQRIAVPLVATRDAMRIRSNAALGPWRLARLDIDGATVPAPAQSAASPARLVVYDQAFDSGWQVAGATAHLRTALGTNVFVTAAPQQSAPEVAFAYARDYHMAYFVGAMALALGLAMGLTLLLGARGQRCVLAGGGVEAP
jgi:hypothetical protein